jgi:anaerobic magnesium-protoporphyrin IX monomethyl ester cyclase
MCDDIFGLKPGWVQSFDSELKSNNLSISYKIQSRADLLLQEDNIDALVNSGLKEVWIGAESGSQKILDAMDKGTTLQQIEDSTTLLQAKGVLVAFFIQYGYLGETKEEVHQTIEMIKRINPDNIGISVSYPLPGTSFYDKVKDQLSEKQNWTDSDDLAMMFQGTFNQSYYKLLHSYTHKIFHQTKGLKSIKTVFTKPLKIKKNNLKSIVRLPYYSYKSFVQGKQLTKMENTHG